MKSTHAELQKMKAVVPEVADLLRLLGTPTRLLLLCHIAQQECAVGDMERDLGIRQPGLSQQLAELRQNKLVSTRRQSRSIFYSIADPRVRMLLSALYTIFCADGLSPLVAAPEPPRPSPAGDTARFARLIPTSAKAKTGTPVPAGASLSP